MAEEIAFENDRISNFKDSWPWPWGSYCIPLCISRWPLPTCWLVDWSLTALSTQCRSYLPTCQISLKLEAFCGRTNERTSLSQLRPTLLGRLMSRWPLPTCWLVDWSLTALSTQCRSSTYMPNFTEIGSFLWTDERTYVTMTVETHFIRSTHE